MARWSFGLRQLFLWTAAIAVGLVALRSASTSWVAAMMGLATAALAVSILLAVFRHGPKRAYCIGFATFGWLYLIVLAASWTIVRMAANDSPLAAHNLPTQQFASASYHWIYDEAFEKHYASITAPRTGVTGTGQTFSFYVGTMSNGASNTRASDASDGRTGLRVNIPAMTGTGPTSASISFATPAGPPPGPSEADFVNVAHAIWTLLFSVIGGSLAHWLYVTGPGRGRRPMDCSAIAAHARSSSVSRGDG